MSLITWEPGVEVVYDDKDDEQQALMLMLTRDASEIAQWSGKVVNVKVQSTGSKVKRVQVRKQMGTFGTNVLIDIGPKEEMHYHVTRLPSDADISISANGKMNYTIDEITELNLVIKEAYGVYHQLTKE